MRSPESAWRLYNDARQALEMLERFSVADTVANYGRRLIVSFGAPEKPGDSELAQFVQDRLRVDFAGAAAKILEGARSDLEGASRELADALENDRQDRLRKRVQNDANRNKAGAS